MDGDAGIAVGSTLAAEGEATGVRAAQPATRIDTSTADAIVDIDDRTSETDIRSLQHVACTSKTSWARCCDIPTPSKRRVEHRSDLWRGIGDQDGPDGGRTVTAGGRSEARP
jgi:hypothetical protein